MIAPVGLAEAARSAALPPHISTPAYDRSQLSVGIVHFGVGGFHRSHQAMYLDRLMERGEALDWAICGVGLLPGDTRMRDALTAQEGLYTLVLKHPDGTREHRVIGSIADMVYAPDDPERVLALMSSPQVRIVSLTITEGAYANLAPSAPGALQSVFDYIVEALRRRRDAGIAAFTVMCCDNIIENGLVARHAVLACARERDPGLVPWIEEEVSFPNSMVDRITPTTTEQDIEDLAADCGLADRWPVVAEPFVQWVLEDSFAASGRPGWGAVGVQLTHDVRPFEMLKLRILNGGHQAATHPGRLLGFAFMHEAMADALVREFLDAYMSEVEGGLPVVPGMDLGQYKQTIRERFGNPGIGDTLLRVGTQASDRIPTFMLPALDEQPDADFPAIMTTVAAWAWSLRGRDEQGRELEFIDSRQEELRHAALAQDHDLLAFLRVAEVFGDLADHPRHARRFAESWLRMREHGVRAAMRAAVPG